MAHWSLFAALAVTVYVIDVLRQWWINWRKAKSTGLPRILLPVLPLSLKLRIFGPLLFPILRRLPESWTQPWLGHLDVMAPWKDGYETYRQVGTDAYILVAPGGLVIVTCAHDAIDQISHRRDHFSRPVEIFAAIARYGDNLASSEGPQWRRMRKLVAKAFSEGNNREVWDETLYQAPKMLSKWSVGEPIPLNADTMQMSQNVISKAGFGYRMPWGDEADASSANSTTHGGMNYIEASRGLVHNILLVIGLPQAALRFSPFQNLRKAYKFDVAFRAHLRDTIRRGRETEGGNDILHSLLRGMEADDDDTLSDEEILGNSFLFMVGGHETTATSMQMAVVLLAMNMRAQKQMQLDIDRIVGDRQPADWSYDKDFPKLQEGWVGAVVQEELRIIPPVPAVLKRTIGDQSVVFEGVQTTVPAGTFIALSQIGAHRNPRYWPCGPPTDPSAPWHPKSNRDNDLEEFKPERWFAKSANDKSSPSSIDPEQTFFRPERGAYFPFSEGVRSCVGRKFAQIEYIAVLAVIFRKYSVELDVREWASDEEVKAMGTDERRAVWAKAAKRAQGIIFDDMALLITMHLGKETEFPLRLVERGEELFTAF